MNTAQDVYCNPKTSSWHAHVTRTGVCCCNLATSTTHCDMGPNVRSQMVFDYQRRDTRSRCDELPRGAYTAPEAEPPGTPQHLRWASSS